MKEISIRVVRNRCRWTIQPMLIATCQIKLGLYGVTSLKEKRQILQSLLKRLPRKFNVAVAEIDYHDVWQTGMIALVTVGNDSGYLHSVLEKAVAWVEHQRPDLPIEAYTIEIF